MVRKGQQRQRAERAATRAREELLDDRQTHGDYMAPPRAECTYREYYVHFDEDGTVRVASRIWTRDKRLADFALTAEVLHLNGLAWEWREVARVDICHGHAHIHALVGDNVAGEPCHVMRIENVNDVHTALRRCTIEIVKYARTLQVEGDQEHD